MDSSISRTVLAQSIDDLPYRSAYRYSVRDIQFDFFSKRWIELHIVKHFIESQHIVFVVRDHFRLRAPKDRRAIIGSLPSPALHNNMLMFFPYVLAIQCPNGIPWAEDVRDNKLREGGFRFVDGFPVHDGNDSRRPFKVEYGGHRIIGNLPRINLIHRFNSVDPQKRRVMLHHRWQYQSSIKSICQIQSVFQTDQLIAPTAGSSIFYILCRFSQYFDRIFGRW
mmetsp:Transcript_36804/g.72372  ORF Transcript_36804/g.72372 Transcript_36804/m.72372 type:complete len:223 (+) Transcript_36804:493-1161(+)